MENVFFMVIGFLMAIVLGSIIIPRILVISLRKRLFDLPDARKVHSRPVSRLGGLTFFPVVLIVMCTMGLFRIDEMEKIPVSTIYEAFCLLAGLMLLYMVGVCDDLVGVRYRRKFQVQILAAAFLPIAGLSLQHMGGLFGWYAISPWLGVPLTMLLTVFLVNAINLIDGIDGLASGLCMVAITLFGISFAWYGQNKQTQLICFFDKLGSIDDKSAARLDGYSGKASRISIDNSLSSYCWQISSGFLCWLFDFYQNRFDF